MIEIKRRHTAAARDELMASTTFGWTLAPAAPATCQPTRRIVLHAGLSWEDFPTRVEARSDARVLSRAFNARVEIVTADGTVVSTIDARAT